MATLEQLERIRDQAAGQRASEDILREPQTNPEEVPGFLRGGPAMGAAAMSLLQRIGNRISPGQPFGEDNLQQMRETFPGETSAVEIGLPMAATGGIPGGAMVQTGIGALTGALTADDPVAGAVTGGGLSAGGAMAGNIIGRIGNARAALQQTDEAGRLLRNMENLGFELTPAQRVGNIATRQLEAGLKSNFLTSGAFERTLTRNQRLLNRIAARAIGQNADNVGVVVRDQAADAMGEVFDSVGDSVPTVEIAGAFADDLAQQGLPARFLQNIDLNNPAGVITGREAMTLRSKLGTASRAAWRNGDDVTGTVLDDLIDELDARMNVPDDVAAEWAVARERWRNLLTLERGASISAEGNVNPQSLLRAQRNFFRERPNTAFLQQETVDLLDATRGAASRAFGDIVPSSGTAERSALQSAFRQAGEGLGGLATLGATVGAGEAFVRIGDRLADPEVVRGMAAAGRAVAGELDRQASE